MGVGVGGAGLPPLPRGWTGSGRGTKWFLHHRGNESITRGENRGSGNSPSSSPLFLRFPPWTGGGGGMKEVPLLRPRTHARTHPRPVSLQSAPSVTLATPAGLSSFCWSLIPSFPFSSSPSQLRPPRRIRCDPPFGSGTSHCQMGKEDPLPDLRWGSLRWTRGHLRPEAEFWQELL